ncbi:hypothetical protein HLH33_00645 [Gluconacetobacter diazotrophicus]|uniref:Uncharacterized protein n=1 Tax=Gluconacetobacter diazotrophicus TaxID=33996 RepID=A0A7W4FBU6_GLUDI|nr:hypothetical protein [Gluconacetobacter diazotrophicus]MBB2154828.1 hypothetical protein [Gluconacetobacter diazotrophicus]
MADMTPEQMAQAILDYLEHGAQEGLKKYGEIMSAADASEAAADQARSAMNAPSTSEGICTTRQPSTAAPGGSRESSTLAPGGSRATSGHAMSM